MRFPRIAVKAVPVLCQDVPSYAMPLRIGKIHCPALLFRAWLGIAFPLPFHASPLLLASVLCLAFASLLYAMPLLCRSIHCDDVPLQVIVLLSQSFAFPFPRSALLFLCFSLQRYSLPINSFSGRFTAMMFRCSSIRFPAVPILCRSTLGYALPLLCCPAHFLAILCFALARLFRRLRPRGSGPCRSCATGPGPGNIRSPATRVPVSGPFHPCR